jgi:hypothetical protein
MHGVESQGRIHLMDVSEEGTLGLLPRGVFYASAVEEMAMLGLQRSGSMRMITE